MRIKGCSGNGEDGSIVKEGGGVVGVSSGISVLVVVVLTGAVKTIVVLLLLVLMVVNVASVAKCFCSGDGIQ